MTPPRARRRTFAQSGCSRPASVSGVLDLSTRTPDETTRAAVLRLAELIEGEDGAPPLSDQALTRLRSPQIEHVVARRDGALVGYAQRDGDGAEVAAAPDAAGALVDAVARPGLMIWSHGRHSRLVDVLRTRGAQPVRELYQLRRGLDDLPDDPPLADGVTIRAFRPGPDDEAWLAVNAAAFATHAEQGRWTAADLQARIAEPWFDADGFLLAERGGSLLGYHWTKVHPDGAGEVYVLGISPDAQGLGLGKALLTRGLHHLQQRGCQVVLLYVDGDNAGARKLYERSGFAEHDLDVQWRFGTAAA
jgi:mycothiol synthase